MSNAEIGAGDIELELGEHQLVLKPTLEACMAISKMGGGGGAQAIVQRIHCLDFETVVDVIALGIGQTSGAQKREIAKSVFQEGVISVAAECTKFVHVVFNGGRLPSDDDDEGGGADADAPLSKQQNSTAS